MKTLKKTLCLVLAVVMVVGALALPASAKDYGDKADIGKDYTTAVTNLTNWKVMEGDANGNFKPKASIQRQEMAAIIYRLLTGDNKGYGKDNSAIYTPYAAKFTDVDAKGWAAGYIGYCANKGIIIGTNEAQTTFEPTREIPGNDVLCMLLRALGYGMNKEYQGADWAKHVAADAARLHLTDGITSKLDAVSQRQEVAQMTYKAATAARVTWSDSEKDYIPYVDPNDPNSKANIALIEKLADVTKTADDDKFGNPGSTTVTHGIKFTYPVKPVEYTWDVITAPAVKDYWTAVPECDVAEALGLSKTTANASTTKTTYTNGTGNVGSDTIVATDTVNTIGHQGRHTLVYADRIVYIDTYLARVTGTTAEVKDPAGHVITTATASLLVYSNRVANPNSATATGTPTAAPVTATTTISNTNNYVVGDMLRVTVLTKAPYNAFVDDDITVVTSEKVTSEEVTISEIIRDSANWTPHGGATATLTEVGFKGTNGKTYLYNYTYGYNNNSSSVLRIRTENIGRTYTVYQDTKGNVLGVDPAPVSDIGVVTSVNIALAANTTNKYVVAYNVLMPNGSTVTVYSVDDTTKKPYTSAVAAQAAANTFWNGSISAAENKDAGILARITATVDGYYTVVAAGTAGNPDANNSYTGTLAAGSVLERGEANAFSVLTARTNGTVTGTYPAYIGTVTNIQNILVDSSTVYFVANYPYNYTANEYQFKDFTISTGFKSVTDMSYNTTIPNASTAPTPSAGTANIDGQRANTLSLEVSAFDTDADGYADFVLVLNDNQQRVRPAVPVLNYAYLMTNPQFATTTSDKNVYGAIINGTAGQTLTLTAVASPLVQNTGLYTYTNQTTNGWDTVTYVSPIFGSPCWGVGNNIGWSVKDDVLVVAPGRFGVQNTFAEDRTGTIDKFLTIADNCAVYLVNPTTGTSTPQSYTLEQLVDAYGTNEIVYQFDANGYVNLIYIVAKGGAETNRDPATTINYVTWTPSGTGIVVGATTGWTGTPGVVRGANGNYVDPGKDYVSIACEWQYLTTNAGEAKWVKAGENFLAGYTYRLKVTMTAADGFVFASAANLNIVNPFSNMTPSAPVFENNNKTVTLYYTPGIANPVTITIDNTKNVGYAGAEKLVIAKGSSTTIQVTVQNGKDLTVSLANEAGTTPVGASVKYRASQVSTNMTTYEVTFSNVTENIIATIDVKDPPKSEAESTDYGPAGSTPSADKTGGMPSSMSTTYGTAITMALSETDPSNIIVTIDEDALEDIEGWKLVKDMADKDEEPATGTDGQPCVVGIVFKPDTDAFKNFTVNNIDCGTVTADDPMNLYVGIGTWDKTNQKVVLRDLDSLKYTVTYTVGDDSSSKGFTWTITFQTKEA